MILQDTVATNMHTGFVHHVCMHKPYSLNKLNLNLQLSMLTCVDLCLALLLYNCTFVVSVHNKYTSPFTLGICISLFIPKVSCNYLLIRDKHRNRGDVHRYVLSMKAYFSWSSCVVSTTQMSEVLPYKEALKLMIILNLLLSMPTRE